MNGIIFPGLLPLRGPFFFFFPIRGAILKIFPFRGEKLKIIPIRGYFLKIFPLFRPEVGTLFHPEVGTQMVRMQDIHTTQYPRCRHFGHITMTSYAMNNGQKILILSTTSNAK